MSGKLVRVAAGVIFLVATVTQANAVLVDYTTVADGTYASVNLGGTTVSGSNSVTSGAIGGFRGLGILGGTFPPNSDLSLDLNETMTVDFGGLATNTTLTIVDIDPVGNVTFGFRAFNGATELGFFGSLTAAIAPQTFDLFALSGGLDMTSFRIELSASAPAGLQIQSVSFDAVPEPSTLALLGLTLAGLVSFRRRK